jgi:thiamine pyrophosphate-dependent acetolactate synthase large subunit-like protein
MHSLAESLIEALKREGIDVVFGIPSVHNIRLYEALRKEPHIKHILCRHETTATHMADGYSRVSNKPGVVIASTGPGTGYVVPAMHEAWGNCSPVILVTTNIPTPGIGMGTGMLHELDNQAALFSGITKRTILIREGDGIEDRVHEAIKTALSGRPGPVYLEVPFDLLKKDFSRSEKDSSVGKEEGCLRNDLKRALSLINSAKQPLFLLGREAGRAGIGKDVLDLAERVGAPIVTNTNGKGVIPEDHPLSFGNVARRGVVREIVQGCDVAVAIGTRLRNVDAKRRGLVLPTLIHIDWDGKWINKNFPAEVALIGHVPALFKELARSVESNPSKNKRLGWISKMKKRLNKEIGEIREFSIELEYLDTIRRSLPRESALFVDNTLLGYWAEYFYPSYCPRGFIGAKGASTIGFAFAAAIGGKIADPERPVLALIGDGGFLYSSQELATCVRHSITFPVIVNNDEAYGVISYLQREKFKKEYESRLTSPDFVSLAHAYGAKAVRVESPASLEEAVKNALHSEDMWVIELAAKFTEPAFGRY